MKNTINDYIDWRGDLKPIDYPFNEIDYLIFSQLAYVNLDHLVHLTFDTSFSLQQLFHVYKEKNQTLNNFQSDPLLNESYTLFEKMANSIRYQNIRVISYINDIDCELIKQFSAMALVLEDESICIAYRGTDDTLIGWHEDFLMLCEKVVLAQLSSVEYLHYIAKYSYSLPFFTTLKNKNLGSSIRQRIKKYFQYSKGRPIVLTGHSKGGNLAMYAGCFANQSVQNKIAQIYNFDGPGFHNEIMISSAYKDMLPRIHSYIPHYSFFGIVLGHEEKYDVVYSHYNGILQHNAFSWQVTPFGFVKDELSYESIQFAIKVIVFLEKLSYEDKRTFVDAMFHLFYSLELSTFTDLSQISYKHILSAIKELRQLNPHIRKTLLEVLHMLWLEAKKTKSK